MARHTSKLRPATRKDAHMIREQEKARKRARLAAAAQRTGRK